MIIRWIQFFWAILQIPGGPSALWRIATGTQRHKSLDN
jgi:hypothetical protein